MRMWRMRSGADACGAWSEGSQRQTILKENEAENLINLKPIYFSLFSLPYPCYLLPRLLRRRVLGELAPFPGSTSRCYCCCCSRWKRTFRSQSRSRFSSKGSKESAVGS